MRASGGGCDSPRDAAWCWAVLPGEATEEMGGGLGSAGVLWCWLGADVVPASAGGCEQCGVSVVGVGGQCSSRVLALGAHQAEL